MSAERARAAVNAAEALQQHDVISQALNTQASIALSRGNREESLALYTHALRVALDHDISSAALRAYNNLASLQAAVDNWTESLRFARDGLALARRVGDRLWEYMLIGETSVALFVTGGWDEAAAMIDPIPSEDTSSLADISEVTGVRTLLEVNRGNLVAAARHLDNVSFLGDSPDAQGRSLYWAARAAALHASGRLEEALAAGRRGHARTRCRRSRPCGSRRRSPWLRRARSSWATWPRSTGCSPGSTRCPRAAGRRRSWPTRRACADAWPPARRTPTPSTASTAAPSSCSPSMAGVVLGGGGACGVGGAARRPRRDRRCGGGGCAGGAHPGVARATPWIDRLHAPGRRRSRPPRDALRPSAVSAVDRGPLGAASRPGEDASPARS